MSLWDALDRGTESLGNLAERGVEVYGKYLKTTEPPPDTDRPETQTEAGPEGDSVAQPLQTAGVNLPVWAMVGLAAAGLYLAFGRGG